MPTEQTYDDLEATDATPFRKGVSKTGNVLKDTGSFIGGLFGGDGDADQDEATGMYVMAGLGLVAIALLLR